MMSDETSLASGESRKRSSSTPTTNIATAANRTGSHVAGNTPAPTCDGVARLRLDERQRDHPVEEEVIRVATGARELRRREPFAERQLREQAEVFVGRGRVERDALVPDPRLAGDDHRQPDARQLHAHLR